MTTDDKIELVKHVIKNLYSRDSYLVGNGLCERCLVNKLSVYLGRSRKLKGYFVDCEFNKQVLGGVASDKIVSNINGNYIDIIVHKRSDIRGENLLCFEVKRRNNTGRKKDRDNLKLLTRLEGFEYTVGFYVILGDSYNTTILELYAEGEFKKKLQLGVDAR